MSKFDFNNYNSHDLSYLKDINSANLKKQNKTPSQEAFIEYQRILLEKIQKLEAQTCKTASQAELYESLRNACTQARTMEELSELQKRYEDIIYSQVSTQAGINQSIFVKNADKISSEDEPAVSRRDEMLDYIKNNVAEYVFDENKKQEINQLLASFDEKDLSTIIQYISEKKINVYNAVSAVKSGVKDDRLDNVLKFTRRNIDFYEAKYIDDNFDEKDGQNLTDVALGKNISVYEAENIIYDTMKSHKDFDFNAAAKYSLLSDEQKINALFLINNKGILPTEAIEIARLSDDKKKLSNASDIININSHITAKGAVKYAQMDEKSKSAVMELVNNPQNCEINPDEIIEMVSLIDDVSLQDKAIDFMQRHKDATGIDASDYISLSDEMKKNAENILANPQYKGFKPNDAIYLSKNIYTPAEIKEMLKFINTFPNSSAKDADEYFRLDELQKKNVKSVMDSYEEGEIPISTVTMIAKQAFPATPEELKIGTDFILNYPNINTDTAVTYIMLGNGETRYVAESILNSSENITPDDAMQLAQCTSKKEFKCAVKFLLDNPDVNAEYALYYASLPVDRDLKIKNVKDKFNGISNSDAILMAALTPLQLNKAKKFYITVNSSSIIDAYNYALLSEKDRKKADEILANPKYKDIKPDEIIRLLTNYPEENNNSELLDIMAKYPNISLENSIQFLNMTPEKRLILEKVLNKPENKNKSISYRIISIADTLKNEEEFDKAIQYIQKYPNAKLFDIIKLIQYTPEQISKIDAILKKYKNMDCNNAIALVGAEGFLEGEDFNKKLKKIIQQPNTIDYQKALLDMLSNLSYKSRFHIFNKGISEQEFLNAVKILNSSTFKNAFKTPNEFLSDIDIKYTTKINDKYPPLPQEELKDEQEKIIKFFTDNIDLIVNALRYLDKDTINQLMAKRTNHFRAELELINGLSQKNLKLLSELLKLTQSTKNKIELCKLVEIYQYNNIDTSSLKELLSFDKISSEMIVSAKRKAKEEILKDILINSGINAEEIQNIPDEKLNFNQDYAQLLNENSDEILKTVISSAVLGDFNDYITDKKNEYGNTNNETRKIFLRNGINYEKWLHPDMDKYEFELNGQKYYIKMWDRNPQEDLFIGNKTNCCTAIGGGNGGATPIYLLNTAFNVALLYDSNNNVVGMSRLFMSKVNNTPAMMMDNIELRDTADLESGIKIRNEFFKYLNKFALGLTDKKNIPIYYTPAYSKVPTDDLKNKFILTGFLGKVSPSTVYINSKQGWVNPAMIKYMGASKWFEVPKYKL